MEKKPTGTGNSTNPQPQRTDTHGPILEKETLRRPKEVMPLDDFAYMAAGFVAEQALEGGNTLPGALKEAIQTYLVHAHYIPPTPIYDPRLGEPARTNHGTLSPPKLEFLHSSDLLKNVQPIDWLVRDFLITDSLCSITGAPETGKSQIALSIAVAIAAGRPWMSNQVQQGTVIYCAGEGRHGMARRLNACEREMAVDASKITLYFARTSIAVNDLDSIEEAAAQIDSICRRERTAPKLIVIDTVQRNFGPGDENSTEHMSRFIQHSDTYLREHYGATVLYCHHTPHCDQERARGSTVYHGCLDTEYLTRRTKKRDGILLQNTKMKDAEQPADINLSMKSVKLDLKDKWGRALTAPTVTLCDQPAKPRNRRALSPPQQQALECLRQLCSASDHLTVAIAEWNRACLEIGLDRRSLTRYREALTRRGFVVILDGQARPLAIG